MHQTAARIQRVPFIFHLELREGKVSFKTEEKTSLDLQTQIPYLFFELVVLYDLL